MRKFLVAALAAVSFAAISSSAHASDVRITVFETISGVSQQVAAWTQDQNPTPQAYVKGFYTTVPITDASGLSIGNETEDTAVTWYSGSNDQLGGFTNYNENFNILTQQSYASLESDPVFLPGIYHGVDVKPDLTYLIASYTIAVIPDPQVTPLFSFRPKFAVFHVDTPVHAVPEPTSWAMMLAGLGMIGFVLRRRLNVSVPDA